MAGLVDVLLGGALTLAGTGLVEVIRTRSASSQRKETRSAVKRDYTRVTMDRLQAAAGKYQATLRLYERALTTASAVAPALEDQLAAHRAEFKTQVYRAPQPVTEAMLAWERAATEWSQQEGSRGTEATRWEEAMKRCGSAVKDHL